MLLVFLRILTDLQYHLCSCSLSTIVEGSPPESEITFRSPCQALSVWYWVTTQQRVKRWGRQLGQSANNHSSPPRTTTHNSAFNTQQQPAVPFSWPRISQVLSECRQSCIIHTPSPSGPIRAGCHLTIPALPMYETDTEVSYLSRHLKIVFHPKIKSDACINTTDGV